MVFIFIRDLFRRIWIMFVLVIRNVWLIRVDEIVVKVVDFKNVWLWGWVKKVIKILEFDLNLVLCNIKIIISKF